MESEVMTEFGKQYGIAGILLAMMSYFLFRTVPKQIAPLLIKVIEKYLNSMTQAWDAHKERLDTAEQRAEERHVVILDAAHQGTRQVIKVLQKIHTDLHEHDQHTVSLHGRAGKMIRKQEDPHSHND